MTKIADNAPAFCAATALAEPTGGVSVGTGYCRCGCGEPVGEGKRYVSQHHARNRKAFLVDPATGCWEWHGRKINRGYGHMSVDGKFVLVHRLHYERVFGSIPDGAELHHRCENKACVNPLHLRLERTHADHMRHHRVLTPEQEVAIRGSTELSAELAKRYGVSAGHIRSVRGPLKAMGVMRKGVR